MRGQTPRTTLTELDRAYAGALAACQAGEEKAAVRMLLGIVSDLEALPDGPETFGLWTRAMLRLARTEQTLGHDDEAARTIRRLVRAWPDVHVEPRQYPPGFRNLVFSIAAQVRAQSTCELTLRSSTKGMRLFVDGREVGTAPTSVRLAPGSYRVSGRVGGTWIPGPTVDVAEGGQSVTIDVTVAQAFRPSLGPGLALAEADRAKGLVTSGAYLRVDRLLAASLVTERGTEYLVGTNVDVRRGVVLREGRVRLSEKAAPAGSLGALVSFLFEGEQSRLVIAAGAPVAGTQEVLFRDPVGDDDGPGKYTYPTDRVFKPGSFDLTELRVTQDGDKVTFTVGVNSDLENPWGMPQPANFSVQMAFVHVQTGKGGHTEGLGGTNVQFVLQDAWNKVVVLSPQPASRVRAEVRQKAADLRADVLVPDEVVGRGRSFSGTVDKKLLGEGDIASWGYQVLMLSAEGFPEGRDLLTRKVVSRSNQWHFGGGTPTDCDPHVIDVLAGKGVGDPSEIDLQHRMLSYECTWYGTAKRRATLEMVRR
jgi:hypothetical protein